MITLELTEEQANQLASLLNLANKAAGLEVARSALDIFERLQAAANEAEKSAVEHPAKSKK